MKNRNILNSLKVAVTTVGIISITGAGANAAVLSNGTTINTFLECLNDGTALVVGKNAAQDGWYYGVDASNDGTGGSAYEMYGMAVKETTDSIFVALNANMSLTGNYDSDAADKNIGWGDLFFNFSGQNFTTAMNGGNLYGVRFAGTNDSGAPNVGLYGGVTAKSVTGENHGWSSMNDYNNAVGANASLGDLAANTSYFDQTKSLNAIASGNFLTGLTYLTKDDLSAAGYNLTKFAGSETVAFKFDKSKLPGAASVPEPSSLAGLGMMGLAFASSKMLKHRAIAK